MSARRGITSGVPVRGSVSMLASPLRQGLGGVKRDAVLTVLDDVRMAGIGYRAAGLIMDDIARYAKVQA